MEVLLVVCLHHIPRCHLEELHESPVLLRGASHSSDTVCVSCKNHPCFFISLNLPGSRGRESRPLGSAAQKALLTGVPVVLVGTE